MNALVFVLGIVVVWLMIGIATGVVMARRGHDFRTWFGLGTIAGPLVVRLIVDAETAPHPGARRAKRGVPGRGPIDVLVGIDGSPESYRALAEVTELIGPRLGRVTVATVLDVEGERDNSPDGDRDRADHDLVAAVEFLASVDVTPTTKILAGAAAEVLEHHAVEEGFDLLAVGPRGRGLSNRVLGSTVEQLVRSNRLPVLVASAAT